MPSIKPTILRIDSSSRPAAELSGGAEGSYSRELADRIMERLHEAYPGAETVVRDLAVNPVPHIADETIKGYYTPPEAMTDALRGATALSDELIAEVKAADAIVISCPIYNFSIPSALKAWIDQIVRMGHTFAYEDRQFRGLVEDRPTFVAFSYGAVGYGEGGPLHAFDHMRPYLTMVLNFIGLQSVEAFTIEATTADEATIAEARSSALQAVDARFATARAA